MEDKKAIIIQARMSSARFPGKMLSTLGGVALVEFIYKRCKASCVEEVVIATSDRQADNPLYEYCMRRGIAAMRGDHDDVLKRYIDIAAGLKAKYIIRVSGDTPFVDLGLMHSTADTLIRDKLDYVSVERETCASCFYCEAVTLSALKRVRDATNDRDDREHVTKFIIDNRKIFSARFLDGRLNPEFMNNVRLTIDYPEDIERANKVVSSLKNKYSFKAGDILDIVRKELTG